MKKLRGLDGPNNANRLVAANIKAARRRLGWTQEEAAAELEKWLGVKWSKAVWSNAESSARNDRVRSFDAEEIRALAHALQVSPDYFFSDVVYIERPFPRADVYVTQDR